MSDERHSSPFLSTINGDIRQQALIATVRSIKPMSRRIICAQFVDYCAAHRALCEMIPTGILPNDISIVAGDRSYSQGAHRDLGILERDAERYLAAVRRGRTLLAVEADEAARARVLEIIEHCAPIEIEEVVGAQG